MVRRYEGGSSMGWVSFSLLSCNLVLESFGQTMFISGDLLATNVAPDKEDMLYYNALIESSAKVRAI